MYLQDSLAGCRVSFPGETQNLPGCNSVQAAVDKPASAGRDMLDDL